MKIICQTSLRNEDYYILFQTSSQKMMLGGVWTYNHPEPSSYLSLERMKHKFILSPADVDQEKFALLPIEFRAREAGHYSATITLKSFDDIRVYRIECTVVKESNIAELEFSSPVHQVVSQDIPIVSNVLFFFVVLYFV